ncbi:MAG: hypothetical protein WCS17_11585, partial [Prevotella sp.]
LLLWQSLQLDLASSVSTYQVSITFTVKLIHTGLYFPGAALVIYPDQLPISSDITLIEAPDNDATIAELVALRAHLPGIEKVADSVPCFHMFPFVAPFLD